MKKFLPVVLLAIACSIVPLLGQADDSTPAQGVVTSKAVKHALREAQSGKYLRSNGASADPSWEDVSVAAPVFSAVLAASNVTGGHNVEITTGDGIAFGTGTTPVANAIKFGSGGGSIIQIVGPSDRDLDIEATGNGNGFFLSAGHTNPGGGACIYMTPEGSQAGDLDLYGGNGTGANKRAGGVLVDTGNSTGTAGGEIDFNTPAPGTSGSTTNSTRTVAKIDGHGNVVLNAKGSGIATDATDGFTYIPTCAGTPTGTPTSFTGAAPMVVDSTNNKLYVYIGGSWRVMN